LEGLKPENVAERERVLTEAKRWAQERVASRCRCGGQLLVIAQEGDGGACGSRISVNITYRHKCPDCFATATSSVTLDDDDF
jgi:hypothetical protein